MVPIGAPPHHRVLGVTGRGNRSSGTGGGQPFVAWEYKKNPMRHAAEKVLGFAIPFTYVVRVWMGNQQTSLGTVAQST